MITEAGKRITKKQQKEHDRQEAIAYLRKILKPGDTVGCILKHVSASGMYRRITLVVCRGGEVANISAWAARAMDDKLCDDGSIGTIGCGMDMGFNLVYNLGRTLFSQPEALHTEYI